MDVTYGRLGGLCTKIRLPKGNSSMNYVKCTLKSSSAYFTLHLSLVIVTRELGKKSNFNL